MRPSQNGNLFRTDAECFFILGFFFASEPDGLSYTDRLASILVLCVDKDFLTLAPGQRGDDGGEHSSVNATSVNVKCTVLCLRQCCGGQQTYIFY